MTTRRIDSNGDWTFGQGRSNYCQRSEEIIQNVITRIRSFKYDWYLDTKAEIDWINILGQLGNKDTILREIERVTLNTDGVKTINTLEIINLSKRKVTISLGFTTIYDSEFLQEIGITP
jgi:hypothetical protein